MCINKISTPTWSFARDGKSELVEKDKKIAILQFITTGLYFFSKNQSFFNAAIVMIVSNKRANSEFFTFSFYNYYIVNKEHFDIYNIPKQSM